MRAPVSLDGSSSVFVMGKARIRWGYGGPSNPIERKLSQKSVHR